MNDKKIRKREKLNQGEGMNGRGKKLPTIKI